MVLESVTHREAREHEEGDRGGENSQGSSPVKEIYISGEGEYLM